MTLKDRLDRMCEVMANSPHGLFDELEPEEWQLLNRLVADALTKIVIDVLDPDVDRLSELVSPEKVAAVTAQARFLMFSGAFFHQIGILRLDPKLVQELMESV